MNATAEVVARIGARALEVYGAMFGYALVHEGRAPGLEELGELVGVSSKSTVLHHVQTLEHAGLVRAVGRGSHRRVELVHLEVEVHDRRPDWLLEATGPLTITHR